MTSNQPSNGLILWEGASFINGMQIVCIAILHSDNRKTGDLVQTYFLVKHVPPVAAVYSGMDRAICGDCLHRGVNRQDRTCYVRLEWAPSVVYQNYVRGKYSRIKDWGIFEYRIIRLGAYGDPASVPRGILEKLRLMSAGVIGYTHQWRQVDLQRYCMASVDTMEEALEARRRGYRTFRVRDYSEAVGVGEVMCPGSEEMGHRLKCVDCRICADSDKKRRHVTIVIHGLPEVVNKAFLRNRIRSRV